MDTNNVVPFVEKTDRRLVVLNAIRENPNISLEDANRVFANRHWCSRVDEFELNQLKKFATQPGEIETLLEQFDDYAFPKVEKILSKLQKNNSLQYFDLVLFAFGISSWPIPLLLLSTFLEGLLLYLLVIAIWLVVLRLVLSIISHLIRVRSNQYFREVFGEEAHLAVIFDNLHYLHQESPSCLNFLETWDARRSPPSLSPKPKEHFSLISKEEKHQLDLQEEEKYKNARDEYYKSDLRAILITRIRNGELTTREAFNQELQSQRSKHSLTSSEWVAFTKFSKRPREIVIELEEQDTAFDVIVNQSLPQLSTKIMVATFFIAFLVECLYLFLVPNAYAFSNLIFCFYACIARVTFVLWLSRWIELWFIRRDYLKEMDLALKDDAPLRRAFWKLHEEDRLKYYPIIQWILSPPRISNDDRSLIGTAAPETEEVA